MGIYQFKTEQYIPAHIDEVWEFISSPNNLKQITPSYLDFKIKSNTLKEKMYEGMMIAYTVKPLLNIKINWLTEITQIEAKKYFIDEQRTGPYKIWHHEHHLTEINGGVLMTDLVTYKPPFGLIGSLANMLLIKRKINEIFDYREQVLNQIFVKK